MSQTITVSASVEVVEGNYQSINIVLSEAGADIMIGLESFKERHVRWEDMQNPKVLAELFRLVMVCIFVEIVEQLGNIQLNKSAYLTLMGVK